MNIQRQIGDHCRHIRKKSGPVEALDLYDRELVRKPVGNDDGGRNGEGAFLPATLGAGSDHFRQALLAGQNLLDELADIVAASCLILVDRELAVDQDRIQRRRLMS